MTFFVILFLLVTDCIAHDSQPANSHDPIEEEICDLKVQRREFDVLHRTFLASYIKNKCPESGTFSLSQRFSQHKWVKQCELINQELNKSHDQLVAIDSKMELLKLKN